MHDRVAIVPATADHAWILGRGLRAADVREVGCLGQMPHAAVFWSYRRALIRKTALVDGEVAAMWGVVGAPLGMVGTPWLLTGPASERVSALTFARIYQAEALGMLRLFPKLENYVDASYTGAVRLLKLAGFTLDEPKPYGLTQSPFRRFEMVA